MDKYTIPKHLDAPVKILFFTLDEFILSVVPCLFFIFMGMPVLAILLFVITLLGIKKLKGEQAFRI
ncbi:MAG: type IV conjugative transfer system protein TraL [Gammaproteobacteria bacterium]|nr:type IV conjugative transfer system protein TraL [Gammaproteobacteria bacterium]